MKLNRKHGLLLSEALIPVLGFFLWDWGLYFILLFYFFDVLAQEIIMHLKSKKIIVAQEFSNPSSWIKLGALSALVVFGIISLIHVSMFYIDPAIGLLGLILVNFLPLKIWSLDKIKYF
jgi:hypothetical protein